MAFWGMGLAQSDEFCEVYDEYIDLYDAGGKPSMITSRLLEKYCQKPEVTPGWQNAYFAIAKAEWMLCAQSANVLNRVNEIIEKDENIRYYRSLGFSDAELTERKKNLLQFLKMLQSAKNAPRKRRISASNQIKRLPKGTVSCYEAEGAYYGFLVLDAVYEGRLLALTEKLPAQPKEAADVLNAPVGNVIWLLLRETPKGNHDIGTIQITGKYNGRAGVFLCKAVAFGANFSFYLGECHRRKLLTLPKQRITNLLQEENVPVKFFNEQTQASETKMVLELMSDPASPFAKNMIRRALCLDVF